VLKSRWWSYLKAARELPAVPLRKKPVGLRERRRRTLKDQLEQEGERQKAEEVHRD
jgi:hypothetical protein